MLQCTHHCPGVEGLWFGAYFNDVFVVLYPTYVARKNQPSLYLSLLCMCAGTDIGKCNIKLYVRLQAGAQPESFSARGQGLFGCSRPVKGQARVTRCPRQDSQQAPIWTTSKGQSLLARQWGPSKPRGSGLARSVSVLKNKLTIRGQLPSECYCEGNKCLLARSEKSRCRTRQNSIISPRHCGFKDDVHRQVRGSASKKEEMRMRAGQSRGEEFRNMGPSTSYLCDMACLQVQSHGI